MQATEIAKQLNCEISFYPKEDYWDQNYWDSSFMFYKNDWEIAIGFGFDKQTWYDFYYGICRKNDTPTISDALRESVQAKLKDTNAFRQDNNWPWYKYFRNDNNINWASDFASTKGDLFLSALKEKLEILTQKLKLDL